MFENVKLVTPYIKRVAIKFLTPYIKLVAIKLLTPYIKYNLSHTPIGTQYRAKGRERGDELEFPGLARWPLTETSLRLSSLVDGLRDQNRVERQRGDQKDLNESLPRLLEQSGAITIGNLTRSRHFNSSASLIALLPATRNDWLQVEQ